MRGPCLAPGLIDTTPPDAVANQERVRRAIIGDDRDQREYLRRLVA